MKAAKESKPTDIDSRRIIFGEVVITGVLIELLSFKNGYKTGRKNTASFYLAVIDLKLIIP